MLDVSADIGKRHHRPVTVHGVPATREVPLSVRTRNGSVAPVNLRDGRACRQARSGLYSRHRKRSQQKRSDDFHLPTSEPRWRPKPSADRWDQSPRRAARLGVGCASCANFGPFWSSFPTFPGTTETIVPGRCQPIALHFGRADARATSRSDSQRSRAAGP
jgi:hypothetical protein